MIRKLIASTLIAAPMTAMAQGAWIEMRPGVFFNAPQVGADTYMVASLSSQGEVSNFFVSFDPFYCYPGESSYNDDFGAVRINGEPVLMILACMNGNEIYKAQTGLGQRFLNDAIEEGDPASINLGPGREFTYSTEDYRAIRLKLLDAADPM